MHERITHDECRRPPARLVDAPPNALLLMKRPPFQAARADRTPIIDNLRQAFHDYFRTP